MFHRLSAVAFCRLGALLVTQGPLWHMNGVLSLPTEVRWASDLDCVLPLHTCDKWDGEGGEHALQEGFRCDAPAEPVEGRLS